MPKVAANGLELEYESFGEASAPTILLIMGLGAQLVHWPEDFCRVLVAAGYRVIRFDNRDAGLSSRVASGPVRLLRAGIRSRLGLQVEAPYTLDDMAADALGLLDALGIRRAHLVGASMGGMIAQLLAARHGDRVDSLTLIMTTSGHRRLPQVGAALGLRLLRRPEGGDRESQIRHSMRTWRLIGSPAFPTEEALLRQKVERAYDRAHDPRAVARQTLAILASGSRTRVLNRITARTLVIHGDRDPLVPPAAGPDLARRIAGAHLEMIAGMGHDLPPQLVPRLAGLILKHTAAAAA